jgi:hypothetical protein
MPEWAKLVELKIENGLKLPSIEGRFFCSRRDPKREAQSWLEAHQRKIKSNQPLIILGLGAGFHIDLLQSEIQNPIHVIELRPELVGCWKAQNPDSHILICHQATGIPFGCLLEFRPAWSGLEAEYETLSRELRQVSRSSLHQSAEEQDLWILAEALKHSQLPENLELTIKDIVQMIPLENQSEEARLWRALRELVQ